MITEQENELRNKYFNETGEKAYTGHLEVNEDVIWSRKYIGWLEQKAINNFVLDTVILRDCVRCKTPQSAKPIKAKGYIHCIKCNYSWKPSV